MTSAACDDDGDGGTGEAAGAGDHGCHEDVEGHVGKYCIAAGYHHSECTNGIASSLMAGCMMEHCLLMHCASLHLDLKADHPACGELQNAWQTCLAAP